MELGTNDAILAQNKLLSQQVELLTQQIKEMREIPNKQQQIASCELCKGDHPTGYVLRQKKKLIIWEIKIQFKATNRGNH